MNPAFASGGSPLINGDLLPALWNHSAHPEAEIECDVWRQTFAASRWKVRYDAAEGAPIFQSMSRDVPADAGVSRSVRLRGGPGVTRDVFFGQRIEAGEAPRYRQPLVFSAWLWCGEETEALLQVASPREDDEFGGPFGTGLDLEHVAPLRIAPRRWMKVEVPLDGTRFRRTGLSLELQFPAKLFAAGGEVHIAALALEGADRAKRSAAAEAALAERYFQRHDSSRINSLGRAFVVNRHELHFQFLFPEMRAFPACTLPHSEEGLRVFTLESLPQEGFRYDVTYRSRGSVIVRATKENHQVPDAFLSFVGDSAAILLDAEP